MQPAVLQDGGYRLTRHCWPFGRSEIRDCLQRRTPGCEYGHRVCGVSDHLRSDITVCRWKARKLFGTKLHTNMPPILRPAAESEILSTTPSPTLHRDGS